MWMRTITHHMKANFLRSKISNSVATFFSHLLWDTPVATVRSEPFLHCAPWYRNTEWKNIDSWRKKTPDRDEDQAKHWGRSCSLKGNLSTAAQMGVIQRKVSFTSRHGQVSWQLLSGCEFVEDKIILGQVPRAKLKQEGKDKIVQLWKLFWQSNYLFSNFSVKMPEMYCDGPVCHLRVSLSLLFVICC